jgi:hypothetical protein
MTTTGATLGKVAGWMIAPFFGATSLARRARTFHPRGPIHHAAVTVDPRVDDVARPLAERLVGRALVRFSGALWKHDESFFDVLGCAIRFRRHDDTSAAPETDDQDLLFATIRRPWTMPFAPFTTNVHDYLGNDYYAVSPFDVGLATPKYLRLHPRAPSTTSGDGSSRAERLEAAVARGQATLHLEIADRPRGPWSPLLKIDLATPAAVDGEALRFRPFRDGRGVRPRGFVHALRRGVYALSQRARPEAKS